jgi:hypothetical protein
MWRPSSCEPADGSTEAEKKAEKGRSPISLLVEEEEGTGVVTSNLRLAAMPGNVRLRRGEAKLPRAVS